MRILICFLLLGTPCLMNAWGFWAHQRINRLAIFTLPPEMFGIYKKNIEYLTEHAVDPDKRRYAVDGEAARHYIDIDHYGEYPFEDFPRYWSEAVEKYSKDTLMAYGINPFHINVEVNRLTQAFVDKDLARIMKISADLGHYVGDSHVPLHTTKNYNGQLTGQKGIHGFWESRLPELFASDYDFFVGKAYYIDNIQMEAWETILESHAALDSVLSLEKQLHNSFSPDRKFGYESRNTVTIRTYSREYSEAYHSMLSGQVERRMRKSILRIGAFWYTAWKRAGSPDLSDLASIILKDKPPNYKKTLKIIDREAEDVGMLFPHRIFPLDKSAEENFHPLLGKRPTYYAWLRRNDLKVKKDGN